MQGRLTWCGNTFAAVRSTIQDTVSQTTAFAAAVYQSDYLREGLYQTVLQGWQGFSRVLDPALVTVLIRSKNIQKVLRRSLPDNLSYMGVVLIYEALLKPWVHTLEGSYAESAIDLLASMYFIRFAARMFVDNISYNLCTCQATVLDNPLNEREKSCECGTTAGIQASLASSFYFIGNSSAVYIASSLLPPMGKYLSAPLRLLLYGQCFVEYKLSAMGMCTPHRYEILNRNNAYAGGMGLSFFLLLAGSNAAISYLLGMPDNNPFVYDALFALLFQHYIMLALLIDKPLPGEKQGIDIFYHSRLVVESLMKQGSEWIVPLLHQQETKDNLLAYMNLLLAYPPVRLLKSIFLHRDTESLDEFAKRPAMRLYIDLHGKKIQLAIEWIINLRHTAYVKPIYFLTDYIPNFIFSVSEKKILGILLEKKLETTLIEINRLVNRVSVAPVIKIINRKRLKDMIEDYPVKAEQPVQLTQKEAGAFQPEDKKMAVIDDYVPIKVPGPQEEDLDGTEDFELLGEVKKSNLRANSLFSSSASLSPIRLGAVPIGVEARKMWG